MKTHGSSVILYPSRLAPRADPGVVPLGVSTVIVGRGRSESWVLHCQHNPAAAHALGRAGVKNLLTCWCWCSVDWRCLCRNTQLRGI